MKNINSENCKYMRIGNGRLIPFSPEVPDLSNGDVKVKYYLTTKLASLEEEFKGNDNVISVDLSKLDTTQLTSMDNAFNGCVNLERINFGSASSTVTMKDAFIGVPAEVELDGEDHQLVDDAEFAIRPPKDYLLFTIPSKDTIITSVEDNGKFNFYATDKGATIPVILSNWDNYDAFVKEKDVNNPELVYFLNTQHCTELGVPKEEKFISKNNKNSIVTTPRVCIADNEILNIHIPDGLDVDYFVIHSSGHNGAKSEYEYVYGSEDGVYMESKVIVPASEGTSDIVVRCRDKRSDYEIFNGTLENCKKVWISIDFYKYHEDQRIPELPPVEHVNLPIDDSAYVELKQIGDKVSSNVNALSGICLSEDKSCFYGVSDTYGLYKIEFDGKSELIVETGKDMEGICLGKDGDLFACIENEQQIIKFTKSSNYKEWSVVSTVDADKLLETMKEFNNGFEGIGYNAKEDVFYLGNQFKPISITKYSLTDGVIGEPFELKFDNTIGGTTEVGDLMYSESEDCLYIIDSRSSNIYKYDMNGNNLESFKTNIGSKPNTESLFIDFENNKLYVACDNATGDIYTFELPAKPQIDASKLRELLGQSEQLEVVLDQDIEIDESISINWIKTLDLNGFTIRNTKRGSTSADKIWMLIVSGKTRKLTIKDSVGTGKVDAGDQMCYVHCCANVKGGATLNIEGGYFTTGADVTGKDRNDCIYSVDSILNISGGKFESTFPWMRGDVPVHYCVNTKDNDSSVVTITGGTFIDMDPSNNLTDPTPVNWVPEGYIVESKEEDGHTLYTVLPQSSTNA